MDDTFQMQNILTNLSEVFEGTEFFIHAIHIQDGTVQKLPDRHDNDKSIYLMVSSIPLRKACYGIIVYRVDPDLKVTVYNTHKLRGDSYARVREFKYRTPKLLLEDARSTERSLITLPF